MTEVREELECAYRILVDCQETNDQERQLQAAMGVIAAWEAVSVEVTELCRRAIAAKALTEAQ
jgi:hypothetical protein